MSRERKDKAAKKHAQAEERWGENREVPWQIYEDCDLCGRHNVINNYPDRQPRVKRFMGVGHCAWCPRNYKGLIRALKFIRWAAKQDGPVGDKARELLGRE